MLPKVKAAISKYIKPLSTGKGGTVTKEDHSRHLTEQLDQRNKKKEQDAKNEGFQKFDQDAPDNVIVLHKDKNNEELTEKSTEEPSEEPKNESSKLTGIALAFLQIKETIISLTTKGSYEKSKGPTGKRKKGNLIDKEVK